MGGYRLQAQLKVRDLVLAPLHACILETWGGEMLLGWQQRRKGLAFWDAWRCTAAVQGLYTNKECSPWLLVQGFLQEQEMASRFLVKDYALSLSFLMRRGR